MTHFDRPTGVIVYPMTEFPEINGPTILARYALMLRTNDDGSHTEVRMVHSEGVSYKVTDEKPWTWTDYAPCEKFTPAQLIDAVPFDAKGVDLSVWVRNHNDRLQSNFYLAYGWAVNDN